jgi:hypothetical protein
VSLLKKVDASLEFTTRIAGIRRDLTLTDELARTEKLLAQERSSKNKLYSLHAPEVECMAKEI